MEYREFGGTGIRVSEIGVGCGGLGGERKQDLEPVIERALELGINFFDTCDTYAEGRSEQTLGRVFAGHAREDIVICTKFGGVIEGGEWHRDISIRHLHEAFEASCRRLRTDYLDIYLVHTPPREICRELDLFAELDKMIEAGKVRAYGLSLESGDFAIEFVDATAGRAIEIFFNLFAQDPRAAFLQVARQKGVGIIPKVPLSSGVLSDSFVPDDPPPNDRRLQRWGPEKYHRLAEYHRKVRPILTAGGRTMAQGALAWLLSFPEVSTVIPGISTLSRLEETAAAAGMRLTAEEMATLDAVDDGALVNRRVT
jgi:aryl-alcohol dehydrogenase-like predicted oxidoreductase